MYYSLTATHHCLMSLRSNAKCITVMRLANTTTNNQQPQVDDYYYVN